MRSTANVLVTGGLGPIGRHVTRSLANAGFSPVVYDSLEGPGGKTLVHGERHVDGVLADLIMVDHALSRYEIDAVVHVSGFSSATEALARPLACYRQNVQNTLTLLQLCMAHGIENLIFASCAAAGETASERTPFAASKRMVEETLADCARSYGLRYVSLRHFSVAGVSEHGAIDAACAAALGERDGFAIHGVDFPTHDRTAVRDYVRIEDLAAAYVAALQHLQRGGTSLVADCGLGHGASVAEVAAAVRSATRRGFPVRRVARRPGDRAYEVADPRVLRDELRWRPRFESFAAVVEATFAEREALGATRERERGTARGGAVPATPAPHVIRRVAPRGATSLGT